MGNAGASSGAPSGPDEGLGEGESDEVSPLKPDPEPLAKPHLLFNRFPPPIPHAPALPTLLTSQYKYTAGCRGTCSHQAFIRSLALSVLPQGWLVGAVARARVAQADSHGRRHLLEGFIYPLTGASAGASAGAKAEGWVQLTDPWGRGDGGRVDSAEDTTDGARVPLPPGQRRHPLPHRFTAPPAGVFFYLLPSCLKLPRRSIKRTNLYLGPLAYGSP